MPPKKNVLQESYWTDCLDYNLPSSVEVVETEQFPPKNALKAGTRLIRLSGTTDELIRHRQRLYSCSTVCVKV